MTGLTYQVKITAIGEVRDQNGTLISTTPVELNGIADEAQVRALTEGEER